MYGQEEKARALAGIKEQPSKEYIESVARRKKEREEEEKSLAKYLADMERIRIAEEIHNLSISGTKHRLR